VLATVGLELKGLPADTRALIDGAAVAGDPFDPELAAVAAELDPTAVAASLDELVAADLVRATGSGRAFAFRHPLVREAVYNHAPPAWQLGAHERIAAVLAARGASAAVRAHHVERFARPGDEQAIELLAEAAAGAAETAPATAARWYEAALRLVPQTDTAQRVELRAPLALALAGTGRLQEGRDILVEVLASFPERSDLALACAGMEALLGLSDDAQRRLLAAYDVAPAEQQPALAVKLASLAACYGEADKVRGWAERARIAPDPAVRAPAEAAGAVGALWAGDGEGAQAMAERAGTLLRTTDDAALTAHLDGFVDVGMGELLTERFAGAAATAARGLVLSHKAGQSRVLVPLSFVAGAALYERLELEAAWRHVDDASESAKLQDIPHLRALALRVRLPIHVLRGEWTEAAAAEDEIAALIPLLTKTFARNTLRVLPAALHVDRDPERLLDEVGPLLLDRVTTLATVSVRVLVRALVAVGRIDDADRWARRGTERAAALRLPAGAVRAACARAEVALARGDAEFAATVALQAAAAAEHAGALRNAVEARLLAGRALGVTGDTEAAKAVLREAADVAGRGGAHGLVGQAARELRRLGARLPAPKASAASGDLSERERDVSELVAKGHSNKEVAAALYLSEKTIENTLTRVYAKLGVRSRVELARRLAPV
jgi:DNA-binding CsgD family transcriptional regulator